MERLKLAVQAYQAALKQMNSWDIIDTYTRNSYERQAVEKLRDKKHAEIMAFEKTKRELIESGN